MKTGILAVTLMLSGCAFSLGNVRPQPSRNADQQQLDTLTCEHNAQMSIQTPGRAAGDFALGFTLVGAPLAVHLDRVKARKVFHDCMNEKGYEVVKDY